jgi:predicted transposase/invertase (TIGR01784 family)
MKTDSIFYRIFQTLPQSFFELINLPPSEANAYDFASVELKQTAFRIDGVFLPTNNQKKIPIYFVEVQFQRDEELYERICAETSLYFYRNRKRFCDWQVVIIYPSRNTEQNDIYPHRGFLRGCLKSGIP